MAGGTYMNSTFANDRDEYSGRHSPKNRSKIVNGNQTKYHSRQIATMIDQLIQSIHDLEALAHDKQETGAYRFDLTMIIDNDAKALESSLRFGRCRWNGGGCHGNRTQNSRRWLRCTRLNSIQCRQLTFNAHYYDFIDVFEIAIVVVVVVIVVVIVGDIVIDVPADVRFCIDFFFVLVRVLIDFAIFLCTFSDRCSSAVHRFLLFNIGPTHIHC